MNDYIQMFKFFSKKSKTYQYSSVKTYPKSDLGSFFEYGNATDSVFGLMIEKKLWDSSPKEI